MTVLDADGHIFEPEAMFENIEEEYYHRRPVLVELPSDAVPNQANTLWIIDGNAIPKITGRGSTFFPLPKSVSLLSKKIPHEDQTLEDVSARLRGMDQFDIDKQVLYPTMFLISGVEDVRLEAALYRAYNTFVGKAAVESGGRLKWTAMVPWRDPEAAVAELRRASDLGASGVFTMGVIFDRQLSDPLFYPVYEAAGDLDLPICVHLGWGCPSVTSVFAENQFFCSATIPVIWGFTFAMTSGLLGRFPKLRMGFIETGAEWIPYAVNQVRRQYEPPTVLRDPSRSRRGIERNYYRDPYDWFKEGRAFVTFEPEEDVDYLLKHIGEDSLMFSTDYPHGDPSSDETFVGKLRKRDDISDRTKSKLLGENANRFYRE